MKSEIHPLHHIDKATWSCGKVIEIGPTLSGEMHLDVCSSCHPLYTGKQKTFDSDGRVDKACQRFARRTSSGKYRLKKPRVVWRVSSTDKGGQHLPLCLENSLLPIGGRGSKIGRQSECLRFVVARHSSSRMRQGRIRLERPRSPSCCR